MPNRPKTARATVEGRGNDIGQVIKLSTQKPASRYNIKRSMLND
jgi:hypothetical protein